MPEPPEQSSPSWSGPWHRHQPRALSEPECAALVAVAEAAGFVELLERGPIEGPCGFTAPGGRHHGRAAVDDPALAEALTERLGWLWGGPPGRLNERLRFYAYDPGQVFPPHTDGFFARAGERSRLTLLLYLNDGFEGGETAFPDEGLVIAPSRGAALVFPHSRWHEGRPVTRGRKLVLRTDVMFEGADFG